MPARQVSAEAWQALRGMPITVRLVVKTRCEKSCLTMQSSKISTSNASTRVGRSTPGSGLKTPARKEPYSPSGIGSEGMLMHHLTRNGYEHHVALVQAACADILEEALGNYMGWEVYRHS